MGQVLHRDLLQGQEPVGAAVLWAQRVNKELAKVRGFLVGDRRGFGKKVLG